MGNIRRLKNGKIHLSPVASRIVAHVWRNSKDGSQEYPVPGWELMKQATDDGHISMSGNQTARELRRFEEEEFGKGGVLSNEYHRRGNHGQRVAFYTVGPLYDEIENRYWEKGQ